VIHTLRPPGWDAAAAEGTKFRSITDSSTSRTDVFSSARRRAVGGGDGRDPHAARRPHVLPAAAALHAARHAAPAAALPLRRARRSLRDCNPRNGRMNVWNGDLARGCAHTSDHAGILPCSCTVLSAPPANGPMAEAAQNLPLSRPHACRYCTCHDIALEDPRQLTSDVAFLYQATMAPLLVGSGAPGLCRTKPCWRCWMRCTCQVRSRHRTPSPSVSPSGAGGSRLYDRPDLGPSPELDGLSGACLLCDMRKMPTSHIDSRVRHRSMGVSGRRLSVLAVDFTLKTHSAAATTDDACHKYSDLVDRVGGLGADWAHMLCE